MRGVLALAHALPVEHVDRPVAAARPRPRLVATTLVDRALAAATRLLLERLDGQPERLDQIVVLVARAAALPWRCATRSSAIWRFFSVSSVT